MLQVSRCMMTESIMKPILTYLQDLNCSKLKKIHLLRFEKLSGKLLPSKCTESYIVGPLLFRSTNGCSLYRKIRRLDAY